MAVQSTSKARLEWPFDFSQYPVNTPLVAQFKKAFEVMKLIEAGGDGGDLISSDPLLNSLPSVKESIARGEILGHSFYCLKKLLSHSSGSKRSLYHSSSREEIIKMTFAKTSFLALHYLYLDSHSKINYQAITVVDGNHGKVFSISLRLCARHLIFWDDSHLIFPKPKQECNVQFIRKWSPTGYPSSSFPDKLHPIEAIVCRGSESVACDSAMTLFSSVCTGMISCFCDVQYRSINAPTIISTTLLNHTSLPPPLYEIIIAYAVASPNVLILSSPHDAGS